MWILQSFQEQLFYRTPPEVATGSCRDGRNLRNCSSSYVQVFRDWWNFQQIGDGWNVRNCLNMNFLKLVETWKWILQNLRCLSCKSKNFVLVVKPTLMSLFWLLGLYLFGMLFALYDSQNWVDYVVVAVWISLIVGCTRYASYTWNFLWHKS